MRMAVLAICVIGTASSVHAKFGHLRIGMASVIAFATLLMDTQATGKLVDDC